MAATYSTWGVLNMLHTGVQLFPLLLVLLVRLDPNHAAKCPEGLPPNTFTETDSMGCVFAESDETQRYDTYDKALARCKEVLGSSAILAEVLSEEDNDTIVKVMKAAEQLIDNASTELAYWWSGLRDDNDDGVWTWKSNGDIPAGGYTHWHPAAVPEHSSFNCMQFLSGTNYEAQWMTFLCIDDYINTHPLCQLK